MSNKERKHNFPPGLSERLSIVDFIETSAAKCKLGAICRVPATGVHSGGHHQKDEDDDGRLDVGVIPCARGRML